VGVAARAVPMIWAELPWWQFPLRALLVYGVLLLFVRLAGKRTIGEFTAFDLLLVVLIAEAMKGAMLGGDHSIAAGILVAGSLVLMNFTLGYISARSQRFDRLIDGEPVVLASNGELFDRALRRNNVPRSDFDESMRTAHIGSLHDVQLAVLEPNGHITFVRREAKGS
jgi:uncharacterized membrane protein YcaP (DUF421 family)